MHGADNTVTESNYLNMLQLFVFPQTDGIEQEEEKGSILLQRDSVPPHFSQNVRSSLRLWFLNRWMGRGEPTPWSPQTPDLSPAYHSRKERESYKISLLRLENLRFILSAKIMNTSVAAVTQEIFQLTWRDIEHYLYICRTTNDEHIQILCDMQENFKSWWTLYSKTHIHISLIKKKCYYVSKLCPTFSITLYLLIPGNDWSLLSHSQDCWCLYQSAVTSKMQKDGMKFNCLGNVDPNVRAQMH